MKNKKITAVVLAVIFGYWTWLYTCNRNGWKFWAGLAINLTGFFLVTLAIPPFPATQAIAIWLNYFLFPVAFLLSALYPFVISILTLGSDIKFAAVLLAWAVTWLWAIIDTLFHPQGYYDSTTPGNKSTALLLAVLFGPAVWLYTYSKNAAKLWISFGLTAIYLAVLVIVLSNAPDILFSFRDFALNSRAGVFLVLKLAFWTAIWAWAVIDTVIKKKEWYESLF